MADLKTTEKRIRTFWKTNNIFAKSMAPDKGGKKRKDFVFYEGPPTANGSPGIHHFIGRSFKDLFARYKTMRGFRVLRKGGWDTHGLPVELQVEKQLGFKSKKDIEAYGIAKFNAKCKKSVWQFKAEWEDFTKRMAYWVDLDEPYITYETPYIESLWNVIKTFSDKELLYQAHRVVPFCTRCGTPLSSHEVALGYKNVEDRSVYVSFKLKDTKLPKKDIRLPRGTAIAAWTTTPWTLPGNVALAVGKDIAYVLARRGEEYFIIAKDLAVKVLGAPLAIEAEFSGRDMVGLRYEALFSVPKLRSAKSYKVYDADFVSTTEGTGVVHTAVMYGDDDYKLGTELGLPKHHTVTEQGTFIGVHKELNGKYVKEHATEQKIVEILQKKGRLISEEHYEHEYPFCWRCGTALLYYAKDSWFVRISALRERLMAANRTINWIPSHLQKGRFGQWLSEGKDWAFSRERYWGTPLPVWMARDRRGRLTGDPLVIGSLEEMDRYRADKPAMLWTMRHGQAENNVDNIIDSGQKKSSLTALGRRQAIRSAKNLKKKLGAKRKKIDVIIASPVQRAKETASLAGAELGIKKVIHDKRLLEIELGPTLTGCHSKKYHDAFPTYRSRFEQRPEKGESLEDLRERMWYLLRELQEEYAGKNVLIVCHEYPIWMLATAANGWSQERAIAEKEKRDPKDFAGFAAIKELVVRNLPRDETGHVDPHRPYIDEVKLRHPKTKKILTRIPDLVDVWFDSGSMPYAQWHWPFENKDIFKSQFPADFISEGIDQTRGWFYTMLAVSVALGKGAPYKNVLSFGHVLDEQGQKMSKSKGNVVEPDKVMDEVGVDAARWYFYTVNAPGDSKLFNMKDVRERRTRFMMTLENCVRFWELYAGNSKREIGNSSDYHHGAKPEHLLDRWLMSRLHRLIDETTERMDQYDPASAARVIEQFVVEEFSQWWLRRSRKRKEAIGLLRHVLLEIDKLLAPFVPYAAEDIHQRLHAGTQANTESVHLHDWPSADPKHVDIALQEQMHRIREFVTAGLAFRKEQGIKVRQPLRSVTVPMAQAPEEDLQQLLKDELNVKEIHYEPAMSVSMDTNISPVLMHEGWARELMRTIQGMRKEAGYNVDQQVRCRWSSEDREVGEVVKQYAEAISSDTAVKPFEQGKKEGKWDITKEFELAPGKSIWLGVKK